MKNHNTFGAGLHCVGGHGSEHLQHRERHPHLSGDTTQQDSFRHLVDDNPAAIFVHQGGRIVYANRAASRWTGAASADQVARRMITDFIHPEAILIALTRSSDPDRSADHAEPITSVMFRLDGTSLDVEATTTTTRWAGHHAHQTVLREISAEKATPATVTRQTSYLEHAPVAMIATDGEGTVIDWNPAAERLYGLGADLARGRPISTSVGAAVDPRALTTAAAAVHDTHHTSTGAPLAVRVTAAAIDDGYLLVCAENNSQLFQSVVSSLNRGIVVIRRDGGIESINPEAIRILGYGANRFPTTHSQRSLDFPVFDTDGHPLPTDQRPVNVTLRTGQPVHGRVLGLRRHDGRQTWISFTTTLLDAHDAENSPVLMSLADVSAEHLTNQQLHHHAHHDSLTGLPNRTRTLALITAALTPSENPRLAALMFIDIDQLKRVNDSLGHHAGDEVLRTCAERLNGVLRSSDALTRVGGDEFVVLVTAPADPDDLQVLSARLHDVLKSPIIIDSQPVYTSASIGVTIIDQTRPVTPAEILRCADTAMYQAKWSGPGQTRFYAPRNGNHYRTQSEGPDLGQDPPAVDGAPPNTVADDILDRQD